VAEHHDEERGEPGDVDCAVAVGFGVLGYRAGVGD
jgi:hypothetical protein